MNIRHECPMPDLSYAVTAPLYVHTAAGQKLVADRWSLEGIYIDAQGTEMCREVMLTIPFQGVEVTFPIKLAATETPDHYSFVELTVRQRETLAVFYKGVLAGQMVPTGDIITSLDTPVDLVPMGETDDEKSAGMAKAKPRLLRILWNVVFYLALALFLGGFLGGQIWQRLSHVTLDHGRFVAPVEAYKAPDAGYVERLYVRDGETVKKGDVIARLEDPDRESDVEEVRAEVLIAERRLKSAQVQLDRHIKDLDRYRAPFADAFYTLWMPWQSHEPRAIAYPPALQQVWDALHRFDSAADLTPGGYHSILADLTARVEEFDLDLRRWKRELRHRKSAADEFKIRAKQDGTVFAVHAAKGDFVARGDMIAEIEDDTPRTAVGWLDDSLATTVYIGMPASVRYSFRGHSKSIQGTVVDLQAGTDAAQPDRFGMVVTIKADNAGVLNTRKWFRQNAPARIDLERSVLGWVWRGGDDGSA